MSSGKWSNLGHLLTPIQIQKFYSRKIFLENIIREKKNHNPKKKIDWKLNEDISLQLQSGVSLVYIYIYTYLYIFIVYIYILLTFYLLS